MKQRTIQTSSEYSNGVAKTKEYLPFFDIKKFILY